MKPIDEVTAILESVTSAMLAASRSESGFEGADLRRVAGDLVGRAAAHRAAGDLGRTIQAAFNAVTAAGCSLAGIEQISAAAIASTSTSPLAAIVRLGCIRFALVEMARIIGGIAFRSREDVLAVTARVNAAFAPVEDEAADRGEHQVYRDIVALHAAVIRDMVQRGRPLPRLVAYAYPRRSPALALANRLYGAADRADELVGENRAVHPLFMPASGRALSA